MILYIKLQEFIKCQDMASNKKMCIYLDMYLLLNAAHQVQFFFFDRDL